MYRYQRKVRMNNEEQVEEGLSLLSAGDAEQADRLFLSVLKKTPNHAGALHGRACIARAIGQPAIAIGWAGQAIQINPQPHYYITLGHALREKGHLIEAEAALRSCLLLTPHDPRAHNALGIVYDQLGNVEKAEQGFKQAVKLQPDNIGFRVDLSRFWIRQHHMDKAIDLAQKGVSLFPERVEFLQELAFLFHAMGKLQETCDLFKKIVQLCPQEAAAQSNLGAVLFHLNQYDEAFQHLKISADLAPDVAATQTNLGLVLMARGYLLEAEKAMHKAYLLQPDDGRIALNLGTILFELVRLDEAEKLYRDLLDKAQRHPSILNDLDRHRVKYNLGTILLSKGNYREGWACFENRNYLLDNLSHQIDVPQWNGELLDGALLIRVEQGLGDMIQFIRYLFLIPWNIRLVIEVPQSAIRLFEMLLLRRERSQTNWRIVGKGKKIPEDVEAQCALMSLPYILEKFEVPKFEPYLFVGEHQSDIVKSSSKLKIGICWAGNPEYRFDRRRSIDPMWLQGFSDFEDIEFQSLQKGVPLELMPKFIHSPLPAGDLLCTATLIDQLDLVITVDTLIAHLAGALGKEVWLLNRYGGDWRWSKGFTDQKTGKNLWYPQMRIFQQHTALSPEEAWPPVISEVQNALKQWKDQKLNQKIK